MDGSTWQLASQVLYPWPWVKGSGTTGHCTSQGAFAPKNCRSEQVSVSTGGAQPGQGRVVYVLHRELMRDVLGEEEFSHVKRRPSLATDTAENTVTVAPERGWWNCT